MLSTTTLIFVQNTGTLCLYFFGMTGLEASFATISYSNCFKITCLIPFGILSFKLILEKYKHILGKGDAWYSVVARMIPACPEGLLLPGIRVSRAGYHRALRSRETG